MPNSSRKLANIFWCSGLFFRSCTIDAGLDAGEIAHLLHELLAYTANIIAFEIARTMEDVKIKIPVPEGMELSNYGSESVKTCGVSDAQA